MNKLCVDTKINDRLKEKILSHLVLVGFNGKEIEGVDKNIEWVYKADNGMKIIKRVERYIKNNVGKVFAFDDDMKKAINNEQKLKRREYLYDVVEEFDWDAGDFGDTRSCFWAGMAYSKKTLRDLGVKALRFYNSNGGGCARAWIAQVKHIGNGECMTSDEGEEYITFNAYGYTPSEVAHIAREILKKKNVLQVELKLPESTYVNKNSAYLITNSDDFKCYKHIVGKESDFSKCEECGAAMFKEENTVCYKCRHANCKICGTEEERENVIEDKCRCCRALIGKCKICEDYVVKAFIIDDVCIMCGGSHETN